MCISTHLPPPFFPIQISALPLSFSCGIHICVPTPSTDYVSIFLRNFMGVPVLRTTDVHNKKETGIPNKVAGTAVWDGRRGLWCWEPEGWFGIGSHMACRLCESTLFPLQHQVAETGLSQFSVLAAEPKGQEIITGKTFLAKVTLIENYINHLEKKIHFNWCHLSTG